MSQISCWSNQMSGGEVATPWSLNQVLETFPESCLSCKSRTRSFFGCHVSLVSHSPDIVIALKWVAKKPFLLNNRGKIVNAKKSRTVLGIFVKTSTSFCCCVQNITKRNINRDYRKYENKNAHSRIRSVRLKSCLVWSGGHSPLYGNIS